MAETLLHARKSDARAVALSSINNRDRFYSNLFTRLSIGVFLTIAASIAATAVLFNQGY